MEQIDLAMVLSFVAGIVIGTVATAILKKRGKSGESEPEPKAYSDETQWLLRKQDLSGSQRQILEFIESRPRTPIKAVQDRFAKVPDRELFYRLEQLHLLGFIHKAREGEQVVYSLTEPFASAVQVRKDDKTVMISRD